MFATRKILKQFKLNIFQHIGDFELKMKQK
jgi:hypothetical protein